MTGLVLGNAVLGAIGGYLLRRTAESVVLTARRGLVARLLRLRIAAIDASEPGDLMSRVTADTTPCCARSPPIRWSAGSPASSPWPRRSR